MGLVGIWEVSPAQFSNRFESYELSNAKRPLNRAPNLFSFSPRRVRIEESNRCYFKYCSQFSTHRFPPFLTYQTERGTLVRKFSTHGDDSWKLLEDLVEQRSMFQFPNFESLIGTIGTSRPCRDAQRREIRAKDGRSIRFGGRSSQKATRFARHGANNGRCTVGIGTSLCIRDTASNLHRSRFRKRTVNLGWGAITETTRSLFVAVSICSKRSHGKSFTDYRSFLRVNSNASRSRSLVKKLLRRLYRRNILERNLFYSFYTEYQSPDILPISYGTRR